MRKWKKALLGASAALLCASLGIYALQDGFAHRDGAFAPDYPRERLQRDSDSETIFLQTGLGPQAVDRLLSEGDFQAILDAQELFFCPPEWECAPLVGWITRRDMRKSPGPAFADIRPGDILVSLSTHSVGWRHGHSALVIDPDTTLECAVLGKDSACFSIKTWERYSSFAVLRLKGADRDLGQDVADYGLSVLTGVPYRLTSGLLGEKAPDPDDWRFGLQCSYLVWYAYQHFGYDLDSDGGRLATPSDLLASELLDVVQVYGMDPRAFLERAR